MMRSLSPRRLCYVGLDASGAEQPPYVLQPPATVPLAMPLAVPLQLRPPSPRQMVAMPLEFVDTRGAQARSPSPRQRACHASWGHVPPQPLMVPRLLPQCAGPVAAPPAPQPLQGWLLKRGRYSGQGWQTRWFTLHPSGLLMYRKEQLTIGDIVEARQRSGRWQSGRLIDILAPRRYQVAWSSGGQEEVNEIRKDAADLEAEKMVPLSARTQVNAFAQPGVSMEAYHLARERPLGIEICNGYEDRTWFIDPGLEVKRDLWMQALRDIIQRLQASGGIDPRLMAGGGYYR